MATPPIDTNGEMKAAQSAVKNFRAALDRTELSPEWRMWVVQSILAGEEAKQLTPKQRQEA